MEFNENIKTEEEHAQELLEEIKRKSISDVSSKKTKKNLSDKKEETQFLFNQDSFPQLINESSRKKNNSGKIENIGNSNKNKDTTKIKKKIQVFENVESEFPSLN